MKIHEGTLNMYYQVKEANKSYIHYDYKYMIFWNRQNYRDSEKKSVVTKGWWDEQVGGGMNRRSTEDSQGKEKYDVIMFSEFIFLQTHSICKTESEH